LGGGGDLLCVPNEVLYAFIFRKQLEAVLLLGSVLDPVTDAVGSETFSRILAAPDPK
jgi:hypothetical protein